jgi:RNA polymerase sporulation-specific sigma factor
MEKFKDKNIELIKKAQNGDKEAINDIMYLYSSFVKKIVRYYGIVLNREDKEDLYIEGLLALQRAVLFFDPDKGDNFDDLAFIVVRNTILDFLKKRKNKPRVTSGEILKGDEQDFENFLFIKERLSEFSKKISPFEREVLKFWLGGYGIGEIAQMLGKSYKSIDNAIQRIKKRFKTLFVNE